MIQIKRNTCGDTRVAKEIPTILDFDDSNHMHAEDVSNMMGEIADRITNAATFHDNTKVCEPMRSLFYRELCATIDGKMEFENGKWYKMHCQMERHHLNKCCPDDVNLIDVIEMICDCVCAGMARTGSVRPVEISSEILQKAVDNTTKMCTDLVEVVEP